MHAHGLLLPARRAAGGIAVAEQHPVLRLQQTAGNRAVQRLIEAQRRESPSEIARGERLTRALNDADWASVSSVLQEGDQAWMLTRLRALTEDQLRLLDDFMRGSGAANTLAHQMVTAVLTQTVMQAGGVQANARPGAAYGTIEGHAASITHGRLVPGGTNAQAAYKFEATFMPTPQLVRATLIEFIQVARVVSTLTSTPDAVGHPVPNDAGANGSNRLTSDNARVDRHTNMNSGWIGIANNGQVQPGRLRPWTPGATQPAYMSDTPSRTVPNVAFDFETAAVCRQGPDAGMVYATVRWGFTIDANMQVIPKEPTYFNKESGDFDLAVAFWNAESSQPGNTQQPLPSNLH
jgi:hypothetical protein